MASLNLDVRSQHTWERRRRVLQGYSSDVLTVHIFIVEASRDPKPFSEALLTNPVLNRLFQKLVLARHVSGDCEVPLGNGVRGPKLFVRPEHCQAVLNHLETYGVEFGLPSRRWYLREMRPRHIIADSEFLPEVSGSLNQRKCQEAYIRAKEKAEFDVQIPKPPFVINIERTFVEVKLPTSDGQTTVSSAAKDDVDPRGQALKKQKMCTFGDTSSSQSQSLSSQSQSQSQASSSSLSQTWQLQEMTLSEHAHGPTDMTPSRIQGVGQVPPSQAQVRGDEAQDVRSVAETEVDEDSPGRRA
mmetsp:Transcript_109314/g.199151  ORF Transcript_109314/g.199151 Transcript_109314/m.199151 type:complete len:300 (-) Transcript_109314:129-1028(-)